MSDSTTIARPYATAVFQVAQGTGQLSRWADFLGYGRCLLQDQKLIALISNPKVPPQDLSNLILDLFEQQMFPHAQNFLQLLIEKERLTLLPEISIIFELLKAKSEQAQKVEVISAYELSESAKNQLAQSLEKKFNCRVTIESRIDSSLIGGAIIRAGDKVIDGSVRGRLQQMANQLQV